MKYLGIAFAIFLLVLAILAVREGVQREHEREAALRAPLPLVIPANDPERK